MLHTNCISGDDCTGNPQIDRSVAENAVGARIDCTIDIKRITRQVGSNTAIVVGGVNTECRCSSATIDRNGAGKSIRLQRIDLDAENALDIPTLITFFGILIVSIHINLGFNHAVDVERIRFDTVTEEF